MQIRTAILLAGLALLGRLVLADGWSLLADEAYYAYWSETLAWGYFDQPPLIAWWFAAMRCLGDHEVLVRLPGIVGSALVPFLLWDHHGSRDFALIWWLAVPPLVWLGFFATPDAPLLLAWAAVFAGAARGGRGWWLAGVAGGVATLCKYSGLAVFPLAVIGARERNRDVLVGAGLHLLVLVPHLAWLATNDAVSVRFQLAEGLLHPGAPGLLGPILVVAQQLAVLTPLTAVAVAWAWCRATPSRVERIAWWTSAPLFLGFLVASFGGPPEAHWPAPAWIGAGVLLSHARGPLERLAWVGMGLGVLASVLLVLHASFGLVQWPSDPADRIREGPLLAASVSAWVRPSAAAADEPVLPVYTERYQEAALLRWYGGLDARAHPACGRPNQFSIGAEPPDGDFWFVRPPTTHAPTCVEVGRRHRLVGQDLGGRVVGRWELFEP